MALPICGRFSDSMELDSNIKFIIINSSYLMMRLRQLSKAPVKVFVAFLSLHSDRIMVPLDHRKGLKHMKEL